MARTPRLAIVLEIVIEEHADIPLALLIEKARRNVCEETEKIARFLTAEERGVGRVIEVNEKIDVESGLDGADGIRPLGNEDGLGILGFIHVAHLGPELHCFLEIRVAFHQRGGHVHAETVGTGIEPVAHDVLHLLTRGKAVGVVHRQLPRLLWIRLGEAVVESRLEVEKVGDVSAVAFRIARDGVQAGRRPVENLVGPDIAIRELVLGSLGGCLEPRVLGGSVPGHEIKADAHAALLGFLEESLQIGIGAVARRNFVEIADVITGIAKGRLEAWVQPDRIASERADVIELGNDARQIADAVAVGVEKALRIDFVEEGVGEPGGAMSFHFMDSWLSEKWVNLGAGKLQDAHCVADAEGILAIHNTKLSRMRAVRKPMSQHVENRSVSVRTSTGLL